jgi:hypothetical protein
MKNSVYYTSLLGGMLKLMALPSLDVFSIYCHWNFFIISPSKAEKLLNSGTTYLPFEYFAGNIRHVPRHIKPIDRFLTKGFIILSLIGFIFIFTAMWLYPEYD